MSLKAMKQALDLLETSWGNGHEDTLKYWNETAQVLRQAIAEAEKQEPVLNKLDWWALIDENQRLRAELKFNTEPPKPRPLIEEEIEKCCFRADAIAEAEKVPSDYLDGHQPDVDIYDVWVEQKT